VTTNLPADLTSFIGRDRELAEVKRLLAGTRLLTLTGPGGVGKTRLALRVASEVAQDYADGVWLVDLAPLKDGGLVAQTAAAVFGLIEDQLEPAWRRLAAYLNAREVLLLLDNCEHLSDACADLAVHLLSACPSLVVLATSRETLNVPGELAWLVPSLTLPVDNHGLTLEQVRECESIRLFVERASSARPAFRLTNQNLTAVAETCKPSLPKTTTTSSTLLVWKKCPTSTLASPPMMAPAGTSAPSSRYGKSGSSWQVAPRANWKTFTFSGGLSGDVCRLRRDAAGASPRITSTARGLLSCHSVKSDQHSSGEIALPGSSSGNFRAAKANFRRYLSLGERVVPGAAPYLHESRGLCLIRVVL